MRDVHNKFEQNNKGARSFVPFDWLGSLIYPTAVTSTRRLEPEKTQYKMWSTDEPLRRGKKKHRYRYDNFIVYTIRKKYHVIIITTSDNCHIRFKYPYARKQSHAF